MGSKPLHHILLEELSRLKKIKVLGTDTEGISTAEDGRVIGHKIIVVQRGANQLIQMLDATPVFYKKSSIKNLEMIQRELGKNDELNKDKSKKVHSQLYTHGDPYLGYWDCEHFAKKQYCESVSIRFPKYAVDVRISMRKYNPRAKDALSQQAHESK